MQNLRYYRFFCYMFLTIGAFIMIVPFVFMLSMSFSGEEQIFTYPPKLFPQSINFDNYKGILETIPFKQYFVNSLIIASVTTVGQVLISALAGYAFARMNFKYKEVIFVIVLITMMIPPQVNIIPLFFIMRTLNWVDTYQAMIIPGMFGGFGVFMMRQWFKMLPKEIEDAAKIDGCGTFGIFWRTALPLAMPAVTTLGIFTFITTWNAFMWPLIVTSSEYMRTLPVGLAQLKAGYREVIMWGELSAYCVICCIPVIILFLMGRKYFINDIMNGGVKE